MVKEELVFTDNIQKNFNEEKITLKDCSEKFLLKIRPDLECLIKSIKPIFFNKNFITFDYKEINNAKNKTPTCRDTNWHIDGKNNMYLICCWGDKRTLFSQQKLNINYNDELRNINNQIQKILNNEENSFEVKNGVLYSYSSQDIHKGRILEKGESRKLLRVCFSDYIKPSNKIIRT